MNNNEPYRLKHLIVNADDFGYTRGVNRAIVEAYRSGVVTSTSLMACGMANGAAFEDAVRLAQEVPGLDVGCHLNFVEGQPVTKPGEIPHLVQRDGRFWSAREFAMRMLCGRIPAREIETESRAQMEKIVASGVAPSHVDTHKHTHMLPAVAEAIARAAQSFGITWMRSPFENCTPRVRGRARWRQWGLTPLNLLASGYKRKMQAMQMQQPDYFTGIAVTGWLDRKAFADTLAVLQPGVTELMCHPGYCDRELEASPTRLQREREVEFETVADRSWRAQLRERKIVLTNFREAGLKRGMEVEKQMAESVQAR